MRLGGGMGLGVVSCSLVTVGMESISRLACLAVGIEESSRSVCVCVCVVRGDSFRHSRSSSIETWMASISSARSTRISANFDVDGGGGDEIDILIVPPQVIE